MKMKKKDLKNYNRLLKEENEALREILQIAENLSGCDCYCKNIALIQGENGELLKDINDLQADWALDYKDALNELKIKHIEETQELRQSYLKTLEIMSAKHTRANDENVRLRGKIAELEADNEKLTDERDRSRNTNRLLRENLDESK